MGQAWLEKIGNYCKYHESNFVILILMKFRNLLKTSLKEVHSLTKL